MNSKILEHCTLFFNFCLMPILAFERYHLSLLSLNVGNAMSVSNVDLLNQEMKGTAADPPKKKKLSASTSDDDEFFDKRQNEEGFLEQLTEDNPIKKNESEESTQKNEDKKT